MNSPPTRRGPASPTGAGPTVVTAAQRTDSLKVAGPTDNSEPDALTAHWPSFVAGYEAAASVSFAAGYRAAEDEMAAVWADTAAAVRVTAGQPSYRQLQLRRGLPDPGPAPTVPSYTECIASWEPEPKRRGSAA